MDNYKEKMQKATEAVGHQLATLRTGRANPDLLGRLVVEYYGTQVPIQQVCSVSVPEHHTLMLNVFDKSAVKEIEKAILTSDLGLNPQVDGLVIRLRLPDLTQDRRKELVKLVKKFGEDGKIAIRNIRRTYLDDLKAKEKSHDISEDELKRFQDLVQKDTDHFSHQIDQLLTAKEQEILTV